VAELTAVIEGIKLAERLHLLPNVLDEELTIISDSLYVVKGASEWIKKWKANGWLTAYRSKNESVKNVEFWVEIDNINQLYKPTWKWVRGHSGNEYNELCDKMATAVLNK
jgi:ribonuclease HI